MQQERSDKRLAIIVATAAGGVIGKDNALPWRLPEDLRYFKSVTMGKPVIMGRKTWESIGRPLPGRANIVLSSRTDLKLPGVTVVDSLERAIEEAGKHGQPTDEAMIIGGERLYRQALDRVSRIYLTSIALEVAGDAFFPEIDSNQWQRQDVGGGTSSSGLEYRFRIYDRTY